MSIIIIDIDRKALREACRLFGGIRAVASKARVNNGNLGRWLKGEKSLSGEGALRVLDAMNMPIGHASTEVVHEWSFHWQMPGFEKAIGLFFPDGAEVARAPWSRWEAKTFLKQLSLSGLGMGNNPSEIYALNDGNVRAVIRRTPGYPMSIGDFGKNFSWKGGNIEEAALDFVVYETHWLEGGLTREEFDLTWNTGYTTWADIMDFARKNSISTPTALDALKKIKE